MRNWIFFLLILIFAILEVTFLDALKIFSVKPDLFLICVVLAAVFLQRRWALALSLASGILKDVFSISTFGLNSLFLPILCFLIIRVSKELSMDSWLAASILTFICVLLYAFFSRLIFMYSSSFIPFFVFLRISLLEALYTALTFPLILRLTKKVIHL
jgi:rod shape-determining protein MreD